MARKYDKVIVIDLEATCWKGDKPEGMENEVIEFGYASLSLEDSNIVRSVSPLVKPTSSEISSFCTELTGHTAEEIAGVGYTFSELIQWIKKKKWHNHTWASWGDYDRIQLERQCKREGLKYPLGRTHLNVKSLFTLVHGLNREVGLGKALDILGLTFEGRPHNGGDDAFNITRVLRLLLQKSGWGLQK